MTDPALPSSGRAAPYDRAVPLQRQELDAGCYNPSAALPYELRVLDFQAAMQDVYDFFFDVNTYLVAKGLPRLDDTLRTANLSGTISDMLTNSLGNHSRVLTPNRHHNGHPDLLVQGIYANDAVASGIEGVEIKSTVKRGAAVDCHGAREQWFCVFVYEVDTATEPAQDRAPMRFTEVYLAHVLPEDFRRNPRSELGTRTATLHRDGIRKLRRSWIYRDDGRAAVPRLNLGWG